MCSQQTGTSLWLRIYIQLHLKIDSTLNVSLLLVRFTIRLLLNVPQLRSSLFSLFLLSFRCNAKFFFVVVVVACLPQCVKPAVINSLM